MTAHKHAAMIKAKADNMDFVAISKRSDENWRAVGDWPEWFQDREYFLCLPKHKDAVLHILNGGDGEVNYGEFWQDCNVGQPAEWHPRWWCMNEVCESRIKPRKEKRWIVAKPRALASMMYFESEEQAQSTVRYSTGEYKGGQVIEIEIEI